MTNMMLHSSGGRPDIQRAVPIAIKTSPHQWMFFMVPSLSWQINYFIQTPHMIADAGLHCWRDQRKISYDQRIYAIYQFLWTLARRPSLLGCLGVISSFLKRRLISGRKKSFGLGANQTSQIITQASFYRLWLERE